MSIEKALRRKLAREREAREEAERLLEGKSRELYEANLKLEERQSSLKQAVGERTAKLQESEARIRAIFQGAVDGIITIDSGGTIDSFNAAACEIFGYAVEEVVGCNVSRLMPEPHRSQHDDFIERYLNEGNPKVIGTGRETVGVRKNGSTFPMYLSVSEVVLDERRLFTGIVHDLSAQKRTEVALAESRKREAEIGGRIQQALLFGQPPEEMMGLDVAALTIPSQSIDGDFFDFFRNDDMCFDLLIGDVMGKGILAALIGAGTKANFLRALNKLTTGTRLPRLTAVVNEVDMLLTPELIELETFVTTLFARVSRATRKVEFVDCGHTGLIHFSAGDNQYRVIEGQDLPLGIVEGESFHQVEVDVDNGDLLLLYSDGLTEARSPSMEQFGSERLQECVRRHRHLGARALINEIHATLVEFSGGEEFGDDFTCIAIRVEPTVAESNGLCSALTLTSDASELRRLRTFVIDSISATEIEEPDWQTELVTAINEIVTNVMRHAYHGQPGRPIRIELEMYPSEAVVRVSHQGIGLKRHSVPSPSLDGTEYGGFGLYLVDRMVDRIAYYENAAGDDCILLVKKVQSS